MISANSINAKGKAVGPIVVVGAGPVGLFTALLLAQASVKVIVYEKGSGIDQSPRAVVYISH